MSDASHALESHPYVLVLGPEDALLQAARDLLAARQPPVDVLIVGDPLAVRLSVFTDGQSGWSVVYGSELGGSRRLRDAVAVLALRVASDTPDHRFHPEDAAYRTSESYAAWLGLLTDPALRVFNRPGGKWPPLDLLSRADVRAIARLSGVATLHEVISGNNVPNASWRVRLGDGAVERVNGGSAPTCDGLPYCHLFLDVPWERLIVSRAGTEVILDLADGRHMSHREERSLLAEAERLFIALNVDVGHAIFLKEHGRFVFSSVSLMTPSGCSAAHVRHLGAVLAQDLFMREHTSLHAAALP